MKENNILYTHSNFSSLNTIPNSNDDASSFNTSFNNVIEINKIKYKHPSDNENNEFELVIDDLSIQKGSINFIIGKFGSGKSTLIKAIIGELKVENNGVQNESKGGICVKGSISYCSQESWLQNKTIKENILFGKDYDSEFYKFCLDLCELKTDIESFKNGDNWLVGQNGGNLSGGQKQRIALCRAFYQNTDVIILDDPFSSLDANIASSIFNKAIISYINKSSKTLICISSQYNLIKTFAENNECRVIPMQEGKINEKFALSEVFSNIIENNDYKSPEDRVIEINLEKKKENNEEEVAIEQKEEFREVGNIKFSTLNNYIQSMNYGIFINFIIIFILEQASRNFIDFWLADQSIQGTKFDFLGVFGGFSTIFAFLLLITFSLALLRTFFMTLGSLIASKKICEKLNHVIIYSKMCFFDKNPIGRIMNRCSDDLSQIDYDIPFQVQVFLGGFIRCIAFPIVIIIQIPYLAPSLK